MSRLYAPQRGPQRAVPAYECSTCSGTGRDPGDRDDSDCPTCFGDGVVYDPEEEPDDCDN